MGQPKFPAMVNTKAPVKPETRKGLKTECIEAPIRRLFRHHGEYVAKHPYPFFIVPVILAGCLSIGMLHFDVEMDTEYLVTPKNGPAKAERRVVSKYFDFDLNDRFLPDRAPVLDGFADIVIKSKHSENNVMTKEHLAEVIQLDQEVRKVKVQDDDGKEVGFDEICARYKGNCIGLPILFIYRYNASIIDHMPITYPNIPFNNKPFFIGNILGGVKFVDNTSTVVDTAEATRLTYYVKYIREKDIELSNKWFIKLTAALSKLDFKHIVFYHCETNSLAEQFNEASADITPKFAAPFTLLIMFSILSCMMNDWVRSKPWLAISGVFSAGISLVSVFGLLSAIGCKAVPQVGLIPFLTLGVGVDNMFILISAWRRAAVDPNLNLPMKRQVQIRMGQAMHEAAMSITITSLTDILAFGIGAITDFRTVELFCLYTGLSILFCYIYCITFFAAAMVFSGWREHANRHCFALVKVAPLEESINRPWCYRFWCTGLIPNDVEKSSITSGSTAATADTTAMSSKEKEAASQNEKFLPVVSVQDPPTVTGSLKEKEAAAANESFLPPVVVRQESKPSDSDDHLVMKFFARIVGPILMKRWMKAVILLLYVLYLTVALWGCAHLRAGVSFSKLSNSDSYLSKYYLSKDELFNKYGPSVSIVIPEQLDYHRKETQEKVLGILKEFENNDKYFVNDQSHCWLREYLKFLKHYPRTIRNEKDFVQTLRYQFLRMNGPDVFNLDLTFNEEGTRIIASRMYVQSRWFQKTEEMMLEARRMAETFKDPKVTVFHQTFVYFDQPVAVLPNTLQNIGIAMAVMFFIAILFVPHPLCAVWVTLAAGSIEAGVIGFMTLWDVNVDFISMTYLILCIGFSVDFSVHITYGFISSTAPTSNAKAIDALGTLGYPIFQSGISTILGIIFLCTSISYLFLSFFKCMILVIVFGVLHAVFVLPVTLSLVGDSCGKCSDGECGDCGECREKLADKGKHLTEKGKQTFCPTVFKADCTDQMSVV